MRCLKILLPFVISVCAQAQQSFFNVPSITVTRNKEFFFQEQGNFLLDKTNTINFNTAYGIGHNTEIGLNLVGVGLGFVKKNPVLLTNSSDTASVPYNPLLMFTALKAIAFTEHLSLGLGAQIGFNPLESYIGTKDVATLDFANFRFEMPAAHLLVCAGAYYSNRVYMGVNNQVGGLFGFEYTVIEHKLLIMGDWIISKNAASVIVPGFVYHPHHNIALSFGWQLPSPGTSNPQGLVFELTLGNFSSK
jgi:hypothetical protein